MCESIKEAMEYIKGYCEKHSFCTKNCKLLDKETYKCMFTGDEIPCDWNIEKEGESDE